MLKALFARSIGPYAVDRGVLLDSFSFNVKR
jgi:hypothetical protein